MIGVRQYVPEDYDTIKHWWTLHGSSVVPPRLLPKVGFVVENVAAAFLYRTDAPVGWIENLISNPSISKDIRSQGIDLLLQTLFEYADSTGIENLVSFTDVDVVVKRAVEKFQVKVHPENYKMLSRRV